MVIGKRRGDVVTSKLLQASKITYAYGQDLLFRNVSISVSPTQIHQIIGPNGSGKTTLLKCLAGFLNPLCGTVEKSSICQFIGYQSWQNEDLTVRQTFNFWQEFYQTDMTAVIKEFDFQQLLNKKIIHLSQGQKQRLALSRLMMKKGEVWLLDEPASSLDKKWQEKIYKMMKTHLDSRGAIVLVSHENIPLPAIQINLEQYK
jgi:heme ABC exporter ATP-binding subunit CcmA